MKNSSCFDDADVEAVSEALKVPSTKLEELIARNNRHRLIDDRVSAVDTGVAPILADASLYGVSVEKT